MRYVLLFILLASSAAYASDEQPQPKGWLVCPKPSALVKNQNTNVWSVPHKPFKSYDTSLVNQISGFLGAQWNGNGINVGQVFCVYQGKNKKDFPVLLAFGVLTYEPSDGQWNPNKNGYRNCISHDPNDCPFEMRLKPKHKDIYKEALELKS